MDLTFLSDENRFRNNSDGYRNMSSNIICIFIIKMRCSSNETIISLTGTDIKMCNYFLCDESTSSLKCKKRSGFTSYKIVNRPGSKIGDNFN